MLNYNSFFESKTADLIQESIIYFTPNFRNALKVIDNPIAKDILSIEATDVKPDITFVSLDKEGYLSFLTMRSAKNAIIKKYPHLFNQPSNALDIVPNSNLADAVWSVDINADGNSTGITKNSRNLIKIGKIVNKIFPDKYTDKQVEEFVNAFKATIENSREKIELVEGDLVEHWYDYNNYQNSSDGSLGGSCMKARKGIFEIYTKNPEICKLVILTEGGKLKGRALLWKVTTKNEELDFEWFLDRQYTSIDSDVIKFKNYAKEKGWAYKTHNNHHSPSRVTFNGQDYSLNMTIRVTPPSNNKYPYMDTFKRFDPSVNTLYNDDKSDSEYDGCYLLENTDGTYNSIEGGSWSDYYGERIPDDMSIYSNPLDDYLWRDRAVNVSRGSRRNRGWYPENFEDLVYSDYYDEYLHTDDSIYSEYMKTWLISDEVIEVVVSISSDGTCKGDYVPNDGEYIDNSKIDNMIWFNWCGQQDRSWSNYDGVVSDILVRNYNKKWIPERFALDAYLVNEPDEELSNVQYLSTIDAYILGYSLNKERSITIDEIEYNTLLKTRNIRSKIILRGDLLNKQLELNFGTDDKIEKRKITITNRLSQLEDEKFVYED